VEELYNSREEMGISKKHLLGYADDLLVLCYSKRNLREVIKKSNNGALKTI